MSSKDNGEFCANLCLLAIRHEEILVLCTMKRLMMFCSLFCRYVEGGMGSVSLTISHAAKEAGANIITNAEVSYKTESMLVRIPLFLSYRSCIEFKY